MVDTHLYLPVKPMLNNLISCFQEVKLWMSENVLKLNGDIFFGSSLCVVNITRQLGTLSITLHDRVKNLGFIFDSYLLFDKQISAVIKERN